MTRQAQKRWVWWNQTVDAALAIAGLTVIGVMIFRWSFPVQGIVLAMACVGGLSTNQLVTVVAERWTGNGK